MGKILTSPDEFFDIIMIFLYDIMSNKDTTILKGEEREKIIDAIEKRGLRTILMQYYLYLDSEKRLKYKRIKDLFYKFNANESIIKILSGNVYEDINSDIPDNFYKTKDTIRKCINIMKKQKYKNPNRVITDDMLDNIITHVLKETE